MKPDKIWCVVSPRGTIRYRHHHRAYCFDWLFCARRAHQGYGDWSGTLAKARADGWRVRRLRPEEVAP